MRLVATDADGQEAVFAASGRTILFPGFLAAYVEGADEPDEAPTTRSACCPAWPRATRWRPRRSRPQAHDTQPPARFTEASLVKRLEELGVGRPSTYASIITTIQDRGYVWKKGSALVPTFTAFAVITLLEQHFPDLVDYAFTARMEDELDDIAAALGRHGAVAARVLLRRADRSADGEVRRRCGRAEASWSRATSGRSTPATVNSIPLGRRRRRRPPDRRPGRVATGPYLERGEGDDQQTASIPDDIPPDELDRRAGGRAARGARRATASLGVASRDRPGRAAQGRPVRALRAGGRARRRDRVQAAHRARCSRTMDPATVTLDDVLPLLALPREVGVDPSDGEMILALNGQLRPLPQEGHRLPVAGDRGADPHRHLEEALKVFAEPKRRRGQAGPSHRCASWARIPTPRSRS